MLELTNVAAPDAHTRELVLAAGLACATIAIAAAIMPGLVPAEPVAITDPGDGLIMRLYERSGALLVCREGVCVQTDSPPPSLPRPGFQTFE